MKIAITILILIGLTSQQCSNGCLKCSTTNVCQLCDITEGYYLNATTCAISTLTNCNILSNSGACVQCVPGYYLGSGTLNCVAVPTASVVANCMTYSGSIACSACMSGFFMNNTLCSAVNITVTNCAYYSANGVCNLCNPGFIFSFNNLACIAVPSTDNCLGYTYGACAYCNSGFTLNQNFYQLTFFATVTPANFAAFYQTDVVNPMALSVCQAITVTNCVTISAFNTCVLCSPGYFLSSGSCVINPIPIIQNCATYSSLVTCLSCNNNFYLSGNSAGNTCVAITAIPTCLSYSPILTTTTCIQCNSTAFVQSNTCVNRTAAVSVPNCATYNLLADQCLTCSSGYSLTSNSLLCLPNIPNCATTNWNNGQTVFTCSVCNDTYVLTTTAGVTTCVSGGIANCRQYLSATVCATCLNKYYLNTAVSPAVCAAHVAISNCITYDPVNFNTCTVCASGYFVFGYYQTCIASSVLVPNCLTYSNDGTACVSCIAGYYPTASPVSCLIVPTGSNCAIYSPAGCTACSAGYIRNPGTVLSPTVSPTCMTPLDYVTKNCDTTITWTGTVTWSSTNYCVGCKINNVPYTPSNVESICVLSSDFALYSPYTATQSANCIRYGLNQASPKSVICQQCANGFYLSGYDTLMEATITPTTCVAACPTSAGANMIIPDDLLGSVNICIPNTSTLAIPNCQRLARTTYITDQSGDYSCNWPATGYGFQFNQPIQTASQPTPGNLYYPFEIVAVTPSTPVTTSSDYYHGFGPLDQTSIMPSIFGYRGILIAPVLYQIPATGQIATALAFCDIGNQAAAGASMNNAAGAFAGYYKIQASSPIYCMRCNPGYQPLFPLLSPALATNNNPVPVCTKMSNCASSTIFFGGLPTYLNSILSCHSCASASFPTIYAEVDALSATLTGTINQYLLVNPIIAGTVGFGCASSPTTFSIAAAAPPATIPFATCAVYGSFSFSTTPTATPVNPAIFCLACASGSVPTYFSAQTAVSGKSAGPTPSFYIPPFAVTACTPSTNCNTVPNNLIYNSCGQCSTATTSPQLYYAYADFRLTNCYQSLTPKCFILATPAAGAAVSTSAGNPCGVCMAGYMLNQDGYCDQLTAPNSASGANFVQSYYASILYAHGTKTAGWDTIFVRTHYLLSFSLLQYGVSSCATNYIQAPAALLSPVLCMQSAYLTNSVTKLFPTNFITNCIKYTTTNPATKPTTFGCFACATGFVATSDNTKCVATIANCQFAVSTTGSTNLCSVCMTNYLNANGVCTNTIIANCLTYINTLTYTPSLPLTCNTCANKYALQANQTCSVGLVQNCNVYPGASVYVCSVCATGYSLVTMSSSLTYCYPVPTTFNCVMLATSNSSPFGYAQGSINCQSCTYPASSPLKLSLWSSTPTPTLAQNTCLPFNAIANCATYAQSGSTIISNTLLCNNCTSGYYLSTDATVCIARTNKPAGCLWYIVSADQCAACGSGLFLNSTATGCIAYPIGIPNCQNYTNISTCAMCVSGAYLTANTCPLSTVVSNCMTYSANYTCTLCNSGYFLTNSTLCTQATALNCLTYSSLSVCATCAFGYAVTTASSISSCTAIVVANCVVLNPANQAACLYCSTNYYLNSASVCTSVTTQISNCLYYASATTCMNCTTGYALSVDASTCANTYTNATDANCASSSLVALPACSMCDMGYNFVNGVCSQCSLYSSGCWVCDINNSTNCLLCQSGFYQVASSLCVNMTPPGPTPTPIPPKDAYIVSFRMLALLGLLFIGFNRKTD